MKNKFNSHSWCFIFTDDTLVKLNSYKAEKQNIYAASRNLFLQKACAMLSHKSIQLVDVGNYLEVVNVVYKVFKNVNTRIATVFHMRLV